MLTLRAPAKINWSLFVLDKREDGYHNILSLMQCVGFYDSIDFDHAGTIILQSNLDLPVEQNLVFKAASLLKDHCGVKSGARITLNKEIPFGAGLGGGSSDAAYTLMALNELWGTRLGADRLRALGALLGSDVPFFIDGPAAVAEGRGELLSPLAVSKSCVLLLVKVECPVPTSWAYGALDNERQEKTGNSAMAGKRESIRLLCDALVSGDLAGLVENMHNDFENPVMQRFPEIKEVKERLIKNGAAAALMSGSGSAVFGLFEDKGAAQKASKQFPSCFCRVVETLV